MAGLPNRSPYATAPLFRRVAVVAVLLTVVLTGPPIAAYAVAGPVNTTAQGIRATIGLPAGGPPPTLNTPQATWRTGDVAQTRAGHPVGEVTTTGGGECTTTATRIRCTGVTVPGAGSVTVSVPVTLASSAVSADDGAPGPSAITARSTPIASATGTTLSTGGGTLVTAGAPQSTGVDLVADEAGGPGADDDATVRVSAAAQPGQPLTGGCVDLDHTGDCAPGGPAVPPPAVATPFDRQLDISAAPATVAPDSTGTAYVGLTSTTDLTGLTVRIPLAGKPAVIGVGAPTAGDGGTCTVSATEILCTGVTATAATGAQIAVPVTVPAGAPADLVWATAQITVRNAAGAEVTGAGLLIRAGAPDHVRTAAVTGPADDTVLPGGTATIVATLGDSGPGAATDALITAHAPFGTVFGPLTGAADAACDPVSPIRLSCRVDLAAGATTAWELPVVVPAGADPAVAVTGGCLDLDGDGVCDLGGGVDRALPDVRLRTPLSRVVTVTADNPSITPGTTATATVTVASPAVRDDLTVRIPATGLPAGVTVTGPAGCGRVADAIECTGVDPAAAGTGIALRVTVAPDVAGGVTWTPVVRVMDGAETLDRGVRAATVGAPAADVEVDVTPTAPGTLLPGGTGEPAVTVINNGPSDRPGAVVEFEAPAGTPLDGGGDGDGGEPTPTPAPAVPDDNSDRGGNGADNLPLTGQNIIALVVLSVLLVIGGVMARLVAQDRPRSDPRGTV